LIKTHIGIIIRLYCNKNIDYIELLDLISLKFVMLNNFTDFNNLILINIIKVVLEFIAIEFVLISHGEFSILK
jgi:hypothetical protein